MPSQQSPKKKKPKRHRVNVGDMVMMYTPSQHTTGVLGEVTHLLDKKRVVVKCMAPNDSDFTGHHIVLETAKPTGKAPNGEERHYYASYITRVAVRVKPKPPKQPKVVLPPKVIESQEELLEHLRSDSREKVVLQLDEGKAS